MRDPEIASRLYERAGLPMFVSDFVFASVRASMYGSDQMVAVRALMRTASLPPRLAGRGFPSEEAAFK